MTHGHKRNGVELTTDVASSHGFDRAVSCVAMSKTNIRTTNVDIHSGKAAVCRRNEAGSSLILALVFTVAVSLIVTGLADWALNNLRNTSSFTSQRLLQNAASSATELAVQNIRYTPLLTTSQTLDASPPSYCWGSGPVSELPISEFSSQPIGGNTEMAVWCSTAWNPVSANTRVVTLSTCPTNITSSATGTAIAAAATSCSLKPELQGVVTFDDYPSGFASAPDPNTCTVYCGTDQTVNNWVWNPTIPVVSSISPTTGSVLGGTSVAISGSGFGANDTVTFVQESGTPAAPVSNGQVLPSTFVTYNSATSVLTATAPPTIAETTYFVTVTSPTGTSAYVNASTGPIVFTYTPGQPTVSGLSPSGGVPAGGNKVIITGTGFVTGARVNFYNTSTQASTPAASTPATVVVSPTQIIAYSPALTPSTAYYIRVTTTAGETSGENANNVFTYTAS
jgi:hypothetical protein